MGYTHYWELKSTASNTKYRKALSDIRKLVKENVSILANGMGDINSKPQLKGLISFNGIEEEGHETFYLPNSVDKFDFERHDGKSFDFCKTNQKRYDPVVVACLCVLKYHLGQSITIRSDGDLKDLQEGIDLASKILGVILMNQFR